MSLVIKKLTTDLSKDYIYFFENIAFSDGTEYSGCYCAFYQAGKAEEKRFQQAEDWTVEAKKMAIEEISDGRLKGYLAYDGEHIVGWVNTNKKKYYLRLTEDLNYVTDEDNEVQGITCFIIDPKGRKEGIATNLLEHVIKSEKEDGVKYIEAYPRIDTSNCMFNFHGYLSTFQKLGFSVYKELEEDAIVRLKI